MKRFVLFLGLLLALAAPADAARKAKVKPPSTLPPVVWRDADIQHTVVIDTNQGRIIAELSPQVAPQAVARFEQLVRMRFYDGLSFFRVIDGFMAQTGDPRNTGQGGSVLPDLPAEFTFTTAPGNPDIAIVDHPPGQDVGFIGALPVISQPAAMAVLRVDGKLTAYPTFCTGVLGMARSDDPNSANSQFYLMRHDHTKLDQKYTAFGRVIVGEDVVRSIKTGEPVADPRDRMTRVQMLADIPDGVRPVVKVVDTKSAYFAALVARTRADTGDSFTICDVDVAGQAK